jgi:hypothetical protein
MNQTTRSSRLIKFLFTSPWFLLIFLAAPAFTVVSHEQHRAYHQNLLLINNGLFLLCIAVRIGWYLLRLPFDIRYGAGSAKRKAFRTLQQSADQLRQRLLGAGFRFDHQGNYGEQHDPGYLGTILLYCGLLLTLSVGCYDNARQYSGVIVTGVGNPVPLNAVATYSGDPIVGPLATPEFLPQLQIKQMIVSDKQWPNGAARIGLIDSDGNEVGDGFTAPGKPFHFRDYEFRLVSFRYQAAIELKEGKSELFAGILRFGSMPVKQNGFDYYAPMPSAGNVTGDAWYNPGTGTMRVIAAKNGKQIVDSYLKMYVKVVDKQGDYQIAFKSLGQAPMIQVVRNRHMPVIVAGLFLALCGLILRLAFRPQRVWLEEAGAECRVHGAGRKTQQLLEL